MNIEQLKITNRTRNSLKRAGINTVEEITSKSATDILFLRGVSIETLADIAQGLLMVNITPQWLQSHAHKFYRTPTATREEISETGTKRRVIDGFYRLTSHYVPSEYWMRERAIAQLNRDNIECVVGDDGCLWRSSRGVVEPELEEELSDNP